MRGLGLLLGAGIYSGDGGGHDAGRPVGRHVPLSDRWRGLYTNDASCGRLNHPHPDGHRDEAATRWEGGGRANDPVWGYGPDLCRARHDDLPGEGALRPLFP